MQLTLIDGVSHFPQAPPTHLCFAPDDVFHLSMLSLKVGSKEHLGSRQAMGILPAEKRQPTRRFEKGDKCGSTPAKTPFRCASNLLQQPTR